MHTHTCMRIYKFKIIKNNIYIYIYAYVHTYSDKQIHIIQIGDTWKQVEQIKYANGDTLRTQYTFPIYIVVCPPVKGQQNRWSFGSRPPTAELRQKRAMPKHLVF